MTVRIGTAIALFCAVFVPGCERKLDDQDPARAYFSQEAGYQWIFLRRDLLREIEDTVVVEIAAETSHEGRQAFEWITHYQAPLGAFGFFDKTLVVNDTDEVRFYDMYDGTCIQRIVFPLEVGHVWSNPYYAYSDYNRVLSRENMVIDGESRSVWRIWHDRFLPEGSTGAHLTDECLFSEDIGFVRHIVTKVENSGYALRHDSLVLAEWTPSGKLHMPVYFPVKPAYAWTYRRYDLKHGTVDTVHVTVGSQTAYVHGMEALALVEQSSGENRIQWIADTRDTVWIFDDIHNLVHAWAFPLHVGRTWSYSSGSSEIHWTVVDSQWELYKARARKLFKIREDRTLTSADYWLADGLGVVRLREESSSYLDSLVLVDHHFQ